MPLAGHGRAGGGGGGERSSWKEVPPGERSTVCRATALGEGGYEGRPRKILCLARSPPARAQKKRESRKLFAAFVFYRDDRFHLVTGLPTSPGSPSGDAAARAVLPIAHGPVSCADFLFHRRTIRARLSRSLAVRQAVPSTSIIFQLIKQDRV